jgi:peptide/nickel transport system substrate-binding protein
MDAYEESDNVEVSKAQFGRWLVRLWPNLAAKGSIDAEADPHPIFSDVRVRQAMRMAVNADEILAGVWSDNGMMTVQWTEFYRDPYKCDVPKPEYDLEGAKALLEEAGWTDTDGDGIRECHGCTTGAPEGYEMVTEFLVYSEWGETLELAHQLIAEDLNDLGMGTELGMVEGAQLWGTYDDGGIEQNGNFDLNLWDDGYAGNQLTDFLWVYYHTDAMEPDMGWNVPRWSNEEFDALLDETYVLDEEYRKEVFCQIAEILDEELSNIPLFVSVEAAGYNPRIQGVVDNANDMITWNVADWEIEE